MSWHYLQGQEEESSEAICWDGKQFVPSKSKTTLERYCFKDSETESFHGSRYGTILQHLTVNHGKGELISFPGGSLVKTFRQQEKELESRATGQDSGKRWPGWLAKYDPDSCSWKTAQCSLLGDWEQFSETFPKWGSMRDGAFWELMTPELVTEGNESGFWPSPDANMGKRGTQPEWKPIRDSGHTAQYTINQAVRDVLNGGTKTRQTYPTPTKTDAIKGGNVSRRPGAMGLSETTGGQLNPPWVEWLMGWPIGWTDLKPLETGKFQEWQESHSLFCQRELSEVVA